MPEIGLGDVTAQSSIDKSSRDNFLMSRTRRRFPVYGELFHYYLSRHTVDNVEFRFNILI
jgi:hypothetical protein